MKMNIVLIILWSFVLLFGYHVLYVQPTIQSVANQKEHYAIDFKGLSQAALNKIHRKERANKEVSAQSMDNFILKLNEVVREVADGEPVFVKGALFSGKKDITPIVARKMNLTLSNGGDQSAEQDKNTEEEKEVELFK